MPVKLHIGMDDTDSVRSMCTTYLAYEVADGLMKLGATFLDYPRLVRLNPNVPWKTRGNGAVAMSVSVYDADVVRGFVTDMMKRYSDVDNGASPGAVFVEGDVPEYMERFAGEATHSIVEMSAARRLAQRAGARTLLLGEGRGLIGAMAAVGYGFVDSTVELLAYRRQGMVGTPRDISPDSVRMMQHATYPRTFSSYDERTGKILVAPRGPDPVLYGLRGEDPGMLCGAAAMISVRERPLGYMIFRTNQGTGDHLRHVMDTAEPYRSGMVHGTVLDTPTMHRGGHLSFAIRAGRRLDCWVYRPTGLAGAAAGLVRGDYVMLGGGMRKGSGSHADALNVELLRVVRLVPLVRYRNPRCESCSKRMKSRGRGQGYGCTRCGTVSGEPVAEAEPRTIKVGEYIPYVTAHRHLTRPAQRTGRMNMVRYEPDIPWFKKSSGE